MIWLALLALSSEADSSKFSSFLMDGSTAVTHGKWYDCAVGFSDDFADTLEPANSVADAALASCRLEESIWLMWLRDIAKTDEYSGAISETEVQLAMAIERQFVSDAIMKNVLRKRYPNASRKFQNRNSE